VVKEVAAVATTADGGYKEAECVERSADVTAAAAAAGGGREGGTAGGERTISARHEGASCSPSSLPAEGLPRRVGELLALR